MERQFHWQTVNLLNVKLEGRLKTQLFTLVNPSADGLGQTAVCERVSHPRHDQQEVEGTRHRRSHTVVEGHERAQEGAQSPLSLAWISPSISFQKKPSKGGVSCCRSTLDCWTHSVTWSVPSWARRFWWFALGSSSSEPGSFATLGPASTGGQPVSPRLWWNFSCASSFFSCWVWGCLPPWCRLPSGSPPLRQVTPGSSEGWIPADWWSVSPSGWPDRDGRVGRSLPQRGLLLPQTGFSRRGLSPLPESTVPGVGWCGSSCWAPCRPCLPSLLLLRTTLEFQCPQRARTCCPVSRPAVVHCRRGRLCRRRSLRFHFVAGPLHGDVERDVRLASQQIRPLANLHFGVALVGRRVAAITVDAGEDMRVALLVWVRASRALGAAGLLRVTLLLGVPKGLAFGAPSHRCGKSLHREQCGTEPCLTGQLRCLDGNLHGKRGLLLAVVESDDSRYGMPSRFQSFFDEFQLVATHGMGPTTPSTMGRGIRAPMGDPPGQLVQACQLALLGLSGASNEPLPGGKRPNGALCCHRFAQQLAAVPYGPSLSNLADPLPKSWITTGKPTNAGARVLGWNCFLRELQSGWLRNCWSGFSGLSGGVFLPRFGGRVGFLHCWCNLRLVGRLGAFHPRVVMATGGSRYDGVGWAGGRGGNRVGHHILSLSGHFQRSSRVQALSIRVGPVAWKPSHSSLARGDLGPLKPLSVCVCVCVGGGGGGCCQALPALSPVSPFGSPVLPWRGRVVVVGGPS